MTAAYVASHWSPDGKGSGYTIAVASSPSMARAMVWRYLCSKGTNQCSGSNLLELEELESFSLFADLAWSLPMEDHGIKCEYSLAADSESGQPAEPVLVAYMPPETSYLTYGGGGHEKEYLVNVAGHDINRYIPDRMSRQLAQLLPEFCVDNRGSRIEIVGRKPYGFRDDDKVLAAVKSVVGENLTTHL